MARLGLKATWNGYRLPVVEDRGRNVAEAWQNLTGFGLCLDADGVRAPDGWAQAPICEESPPGNLAFWPAVKFSSFSGAICAINIGCSLTKIIRARTGGEGEQICAIFGARNR
jgi:hypothetical protein